MDYSELKAIRLFNQHLTNPSDKITVARDLNGVQAQFLTNAFHALKIRSSETLGESDWGAGLVKNWSLRGTMHVFAESDLPLFLHDGRTHFLRSIDKLEGDELISAPRKKFFANLILGQISLGNGERDALKKICVENGLTQTEAQSVFDPWGGTLRALCGGGFISYEARQKRAFRLNPPFTPMSAADAQKEIARRYFTYYGPASLKDAAYYFCKPQIRVRDMLSLPLQKATVNGTDYFYAGALSQNPPEIPRCLFLAGFDQLLMGYDKKDNPVLSREHTQKIFIRTGIVMPSVLIDGTTAAVWKKEKNSLKLRVLRPFSPAEKSAAKETAEKLFPSVQNIGFEDY